MTKQEAIINISTIFNRKSSLDVETSYFTNKKHDDLLDLLLRYIENSSALIGNPNVFKTQALNDHGVDLIIEYPNECKIGIQIKSHFDVTEKDFAVKVKAQFAESQFHGLTKWYLLICSPLTEFDGKSYSSKISHLINELSSYKTSYHVVHNPQQMVNIFTGGIMADMEFRSIKNQYYCEEINWAEIIKELYSGNKQKSYLDVEPDASEKATKNAGLYNSYLNMTTDEEKQSSIDDLNDLLELLKKLSKMTRGFLSVCISRGRITNHGMFDRIVVLCHDIENYLNIRSNTLKKEVAVLDSHGIAYLDNIDGDNNYYVVVRNTNSNYNILATVKEFCTNKKVDMKQIIIDLDFSLFDD
ncbi:hypothetical protein AAEO56_00180 [Flavobacterium sp. DGU11]|uniref:PD-(D/E)XK nuclease superfamily protein n=1 Tax=Flavobacterium arundinis TaxID=3139143 RepID=A0ABU9HR70_9FLAO